MLKRWITGWGLVLVGLGAAQAQSDGRTLNMLCSAGTQYCEVLAKA